MGNCKDRGKEEENHISHTACFEIDKQIDMTSHLGAQRIIKYLCLRRVGGKAWETMGLEAECGRRRGGGNKRRAAVTALND